MNKLSASIVIIVIVVLGIIGWRFYQRETSIFENNASVSTENTTPTNFTASFEIYTNGEKRIFTQAMYHNQSPDAYIENPDPSIIYVKKDGITWDNFFKTLPFSLTKDCLVTGTKQTFCSNETKKLRFLLNGLDNSDTLKTPIKPGDSLKITYGN